MTIPVWLFMAWIIGAYVAGYCSGNYYAKR